MGENRWRPSWPDGRRGQKLLNVGGLLDGCDCCEEGGAGDVAVAAADVGGGDVVVGDLNGVVVVVGAGGGAGADGVGADCPRLELGCRMGNFRRAIADGPPDVVRHEFRPGGDASSRGDGGDGYGDDERDGHRRKRRRRLQRPRMGSASEVEADGDGCDDDVDYDCCCCYY